MQLGSSWAHVRARWLFKTAPGGPRCRFGTVWGAFGDVFGTIVEPRGAVFGAILVAHPSAGQTQDFQDKTGENTKVFALDYASNSLCSEVADPYKTCIFTV